MRNDAMSAIPTLRNTKRISLRRRRRPFLELLEARQLLTHTHRHRHQRFSH